MNEVEQALREALEWALRKIAEPDMGLVPPPGIVLADTGAFMVLGQRKVTRCLIINDAYLDGLATGECPALVWHESKEAVERGGA